VKLSKTSSYAAIALAYLSTRRDEGPIQARQIADYLDIPVDSTLKILQALARHQVIRSQLGRSGGYVFHRDPKTLTLLQVVEAMDGPFEQALPFDDEHPQFADTCGRLKATCSNAATQLRKVFDQCTIWDLAATSDEPASLAVAG